MNEVKMLSKNISSAEISCICGCGFDKISQAIIEVVQDCRDHFGRPAIINDGNHSACRCETHNREVGGSETSKHLPDKINKIGRAVDFHISGIAPIRVYEYIDKKYPNSLGLGIYDTFCHVDDRLDRAHRWNKETK